MGASPKNGTTSIVCDDSLQPADMGKQEQQQVLKNTTTKKYNAFDKPCAEPSLIKLCHGEKGCHEMERFAGTQSCWNETTRNNAPQGSMWHNKTKSSLVRDQNQSLKRIGTVLVRWVDSVYLDRNSKNIHRIFYHVYLPPKLILRHASWLLATDGSKSFLVAQTTGKSRKRQ